MLWTTSVRVSLTPIFFLLQIHISGPCEVTVVQTLLQFGVISDSVVHPPLVSHTADLRSASLIQFLLTYPLTQFTTTTLSGHLNRCVFKSLVFSDHYDCFDKTTVVPLFWPIFLVLFYPTLLYHCYLYLFEKFLKTTLLLVLLYPHSFPYTPDSSQKRYPQRIPYKRTTTLPKTSLPFWLLRSLSLLTNCLQELVRFPLD